MKKVVKKIKDFINEYGSASFGIAIIILAVCATSWLILCGLWYLWSLLINIEYRWFTPSAIWIIGVFFIQFNIHKAKKEFEEIEEIQNEEES